jgi:hypothetical protein
MTLNRHFAGKTGTQFMDWRDYPDLDVIYGNLHKLVRTLIGDIIIPFVRETV